MKRLLLLCLFATGALGNEQSGSLNTYNGEGATTNSNNTTEDNSTSNSYSGAGASSQIPVGSAISPTYMSNGVETCLKGTGSSFQTVLLGWSRGKYVDSEGCTRRRDALVLNQLGMAVGAISRLCDSVKVFRAMLNSGTPCPILSGGKLVVGRKAIMVLKAQPETYIPDYSDDKEYYDALLQIGEVVEDEEGDIDIVAKFRTSKQ
jgi:hypothetical protein